MSSSSSSSPPGRSRKASSASHVYYTNAVYFPNQNIYHGETPGALNYSCINTVYYSFASISLDGGVFVSSPLSAGLCAALLLQGRPSNPLSGQTAKRRIC